MTRGYDATLVGDAHTTVDFTSYGAPPPDQVIAHTNLYWKYQTAPGRAGAVVNADALEFQPNARRVVSAVRVIQNRHTRGESSGSRGRTRRVSRLATSQAVE